MSKLQFQYDKKQLPQIVGLGILSTGMFGYFTVKILTPPPAERAMADSSTVPAVKAKPAAPVASTVQTTIETASAPTGTDTATDEAALTDGAPPTSTMHDPFVAVALPADNTTVVTTKPVQQVATNVLPVPHLGPLQPMPSSGAIQPLSGLALSTVPAPPTAPTVPWSVTGVLWGPGHENCMAVLVSGTVPKFVALGDMVDNQYRLIGIDRKGVTLAHGSKHYRLKLEDNQANTPATAPVANLAAGAVPVASPATAPTQQTPITTNPVPVLPANPPAQLPDASDVPSPVGLQNSSVAQPATLN